MPKSMSRGGMWNAVENEPQILEHLVRIEARLSLSIDNSNLIFSLRAISLGTWSKNACCTHQRPRTDERLERPPGPHHRGRPPKLQKLPRPQVFEHDFMDHAAFLALDTTNRRAVEETEWEQGEENLATGRKYHPDSVGSSARSTSDGRRNILDNGEDYIEYTRRGETQANEESRGIIMECLGGAEGRERTAEVTDRYGANALHCMKPMQSASFETSAHILTNPGYGGVAKAGASDLSSGGLNIERWRAARVEDSKRLQRNKEGEGETGRENIGVVRYADWIDSRGSKVTKPVKELGQSALGRKQTGSFYGEGERGRAAEDKLGFILSHLDSPRNLPPSKGCSLHVCAEPREGRLPREKKIILS
ncbi:hypothetical protein B0H16DRAFT_1474545 [Mycena metata]|uniref:Uncharacterized protein n=1 Tax=Mycena metata TaxID=1033252 RepID=A0AAD7HGE9_9AGAR|nr:hypothetical protein B0H16DRAFT_1474545 [Mycena metata]